MNLPGTHQPSIFSYVYRKYGGTIREACRHYTRTSINVCKEYEHLRFNHRCKNENILPKSLHFRPPVKTNKGYKIAKNFGKQFLNLRISESHHKIVRLKSELTKVRNILLNGINPQELCYLNSYTNMKICHIRANLNNKHLLKFERIKSMIEEKRRNKINSTGIITETQSEAIKKNWVHNFSDRPLNSSELSVLQKGFKFAIAPKQIPVPEMLIGVERGLRYVNNEAIADITRSKITGILKNAKIPSSNITKEEKEALSILRSDNSIVILNTDKGNSTVILNKSAYIEKMLNLLQDTNTYKICTQKEPLKQVQNNLNLFIRNLKEDNKIQKFEFFSLRCSEVCLARIYGLVKVHKINMPLRPIIAMCGTPTYNLSRYLVRYLSSIIEFPYTLKNSTHFVERIRNIIVNDNESMVSYDVRNMYPSIPPKLAITCILDTFKDSTDLPYGGIDGNSWTIDDVRTALEICFSAPFFIFQGTVYKQIFGLPIGDPLSSISSNFVMNQLETKALTSFLHPPKCWSRFVDDIFSIIQTQYINTFLEHLNNIIPSINFTTETENNNKISFLDVTVTRLNTGSLTTSLFQKPTHTNRYLNFNSHHPLTQKSAIAHTLYHRTSCIVEDANVRQNEDQKIFEMLRINGFPEKLARRPSTRISLPSDKPQHIGFTTLPYIQGTAEIIKRVMQNVGIAVAFKPIKTIKNFLPNIKDPLKEEEKTGIIYKIPCKDCKFCYIGQTGRSLVTRLKEHKNFVKNKQTEKSALSQHSVENHHLINWGGVKIIHMESDYRKRLFMESWYINQYEFVINRNDGARLSSVYRELL